MKKSKWKKVETAVEFRQQGCIEECLVSKVGRNCLVNNAIKLKCNYHYNGSGTQAFGGAKQWPVITLEWAFQEGEETLRDVVARRLKEFVEEQKKA